MKFSTRFFNSVFVLLDNSIMSVIIENVDEEKKEGVMMLFENKKESGGESIVSHEYKQHEKLLVLTYETPEVAERVAKFGPVVFQNREYIAKPFTKDKSDKASCSNDSTENGTFIHC